MDEFFYKRWDGRIIRCADITKNNSGIIDAIGRVEILLAKDTKTEPSSSDFNQVTYVAADDA